MSADSGASQIFLEVVVGNCDLNRDEKNAFRDSLGTYPILFLLSKGLSQIHTVGIGLRLKTKTIINHFCLPRRSKK